MKFLEPFKSYKITRKTLIKLHKRGMAQGALESLATLEEAYYQSEENFVKRLASLENARIDEYQDQILALSGGYFRLDPYIGNKTVREWVEALVFALVVAIVVRYFLVSPFQIPSGSMEPTIKVGDHIFATMYSYGVRVPFTDMRIAPQPVKRGDIVIFPFPPNPEQDFIKRVIGLGGDTVEIRDDVLYLNGKKKDEPYKHLDPELRLRHQMMVADPRLKLTDNTSNFGPVTVPADHFIVMGDNRYNSYDGREWGFVAINKIKGKGQFIYWSKDPRQGLFDGFQLDRLGHSLYDLIGERSQ